MKKLKVFEIPFSGLKQGKHQFKFEVENSFFEAFGYSEFHEANLTVDIDLDKKSSLLELDFAAKGKVNILCDLSGEPYDQPLEGKLSLVVKFGDEFNDENDEILILPHGEHQVNVSQYIYEMIILSVPAKRIHPGILDGSLQSDAVKKLEELQPKTSNNNDETDPRWDTLKKLLTDK